ncbi:MAG TPA: glycosyltransferase [Opitutaceae bacterium]|nr:glycosyltransferase [Opitutaceae bacterium]
MPMPEEILVVTATLGNSRWLGETVASVARVRAAGLAGIRHRLAAPAEAVDRLRAQFPECEVIESQAKGVYGAVAEAAGFAGSWNWMAWLNDDDRWEPGFEHLIRAALITDDAGCGVIYGGVRYVSDAGVDLGPLPSAPERAAADALASGRVPFSQQGILVSRSAWEKAGGFDARWPLAADHDFWCRVAALGFSFKKVRTLAASFRLRPGQLSSGRGAVAAELAQIRAELSTKPARPAKLFPMILMRLGTVRSAAVRWWRAGVCRSEDLYARYSGDLPGTVLVNPLLSSQPTGMEVAAAGARALLVPAMVRESTALDGTFRWINDKIPLAPLRLVVRFLVAQAVPFFFRGMRLLYTSPHAPAWRTRRHIAMVYDLVPLEFPWQSKSQALYCRYVLPTVVRRAQRVVTISQTVKSELLAFVPRLAHRKVIVIPVYSLQLEEAARATHEEHDSKSSAGSPRPVLVVGARSRHKNLALVFRALAFLRRREGSAPPLVVAGCKPDLWKSYYGWEELTKNELLTIIERPSDAQIRALYRRALCLVYPSLAEGQGLPPLEALACGRPVICTDLPVLRETCGDSATYVGLRDAEGLASEIDALQKGRVISDAAQGSRADETVRRFLKPAILPRWEALLQSGGSPPASETH